MKTNNKPKGAQAKNPPDRGSAEKTSVEINLEEPAHFHSNCVRKYREALGLTQKALAEKLNTSQQQVQRIECGQTVRLDTALAICNVLNQKLDEVFPKAAKFTQTLQRQNRHDDLKKLLSVGIDPDFLYWTAIFETTLGHKGYLRMNSEDTECLQNCLFNCTTSGNTFFVGDHEGQTVVLNINHLRYVNVCFDFAAACQADDKPIFPDLVEGNDAQNDSGGIRVFLKNRQKPMFFNIEPDSSREEGELNRMIERLENYGDLGDEEDVFVSFTDADGEEVFVRIEEIVLLSIDKIYLCPELLDAEVEED